MKSRRTLNKHIYVSADTEFLDFLLAKKVQNCAMTVILEQGKIV